MIKVSFTIPCYNDIRFIERTLQSVLGEADEIILSDNASTDGTSDICQTYASKYPEIRYTRHKENIGGTPNMRFSIEQTRGQYIRVGAGHDLFSRGSTKSMLNLMENDPCVVMVYFRYLLYINSEYNIIDHLTYSRDLREGLQSDSPFIRVKTFLEKIQDTSYFLCLYKADILKQSFAMCTFKDWFTEGIIMMYVLSKGKAVADDNSLFFRMSSHEETDKLQSNRDAWAKATMYRWTGKEYNYLSFPMANICDTYNLANIMAADPAAPENYTRDILNIALKLFAIPQWCKIVDENMTPHFPEKEELYKEVFGIVSKYQNRRISRSPIWKYIRKIHRFVNKIYNFIGRILRFRANIV
jgi:glycosyltransferase involved in cell wall biosynthesis